jgi:hypothetical protein
MARWLVSRGAKYLILLSRSGPRTTEAHELGAQFKEAGVRCEMPVCDVTDRGALRSVLASCSESMPPVKGCIQSSMVMTVKTHFLANAMVHVTKLISYLPGTNLPANVV